MADAVTAPDAAQPQGMGPLLRSALALLEQALGLYRKHAAVFLITAAALFVPGSLFSSCALSLTLSPLARQAAELEDVGQRVAERGQALARRMHEQSKRQTVDPKALAEFAADYERNWREMGGANIRLAGLFTGGLLALALGLLGWALIALILYGLVLPLTQGALTLAVVDRLDGGTAGWRDHWRLLYRRRAPLLSAVIPVALMCMVGYFFLVLPGMVISFFYSFVAPVVLIEGLTGQAALKRSFALVRSDWLRVALVMVSFAVLNTLTARWRRRGTWRRRSPRAAPASPRARAGVSPPCSNTSVAVESDRAWRARWARPRTARGAGRAAGAGTSGAMPLAPLTEQRRC